MNHISPISSAPHSDPNGPAPVATPPARPAAVAPAIRPATSIGSPVSVDKVRDMASAARELVSQIGHAPHRHTPKAGPAGIARPVPPQSDAQLRSHLALGTDLIGANPFNGKPAVTIERQLAAADTKEAAMAKLRKIDNPMGKVAIAVEVIGGGNVTYGIVQVDRADFDKSVRQLKEARGVGISTRVVGANYQAHVRA